MELYGRSCKRPRCFILCQVRSNGNLLYQSSFLRTQFVHICNPQVIRCFSIALSSFIVTIYIVLCISSLVVPSSILFVFLGRKINWLRPLGNDNSEIANGRCDLIRGSLHRSAHHPLFHLPNCVKAGTKTATEVCVTRISRYHPTITQLLNAFNVPALALRSMVIITIATRKKPALMEVPCRSATRISLRRRLVKQKEVINRGTYETQNELLWFFEVWRFGVPGKIKDTSKFIPPIEYVWTLRKLGWFHFSFFAWRGKRDD